MLPVDSGAERRTAVILLEELARSSRRTGLILRKPLGTFDLPDRRVAPPPDFLIEDRRSGATVAVETMGAVDDLSYIERKPRTHDLMRRIPGVTDLLEHDHVGTGDVQVRHQLRDAIAHLDPPFDRSPTDRVRSQRRRQAAASSAQPARSDDDRRKERNERCAG